MKKHILTLITIALSVFITGDNSASESKEYFRTYEFKGLSKAGEEYIKTQGFDWDNENALALLRYLSKLHSDARNAFLNDALHFNWVSSRDISALIDLVESDDPCSRVCTSLYSGVATPSTVGIEARRLILSYWQGYYPPAFGHDDNNIASASVCMEWYKKWNCARNKKAETPRGTEKDPRGGNGAKIREKGKKIPGGLLLIFPLKLAFSVSIE